MTMDKPTKPTKCPECGSYSYITELDSYSAYSVKDGLLVFEERRDTQECLRLWCDECGWEAPRDWWDHQGRENVLGGITPCR